MFLLFNMVYGEYHAIWFFSFNILITFINNKHYLFFTTRYFDYLNNFLWVIGNLHYPFNRWKIK